MTLPTFSLVEPVVMGLRKRLEDDLPGAITTINSSVTDGILLDDPEQVLDYVPPMDTLTVFPTVGIRHGRGRFEDDGNTFASGSWRLYVVCALQNADIEGLERQLRRYLLAASRVALNGRFIPAESGGGRAAWGLSDVDFDFGPMLGEFPNRGEPPSSFMSYAAVSFIAKTDEDA